MITSKRIDKCYGKEAVNDVSSYPIMYISILPAPSSHLA